MAAIPPVCDFGWRAVGFAFPDTEGRAWRPQEPKGPKAPLPPSNCNHCP